MGKGRWSNISGISYGIRWRLVFSSTFVVLSSCCSHFSSPTTEVRNYSLVYEKEYWPKIDDRAKPSTYQSIPSFRPASLTQSFFLSFRHGIIRLISIYKSTYFLSALPFLSSPSSTKASFPFFFLAPIPTSASASSSVPVYSIGLAAGSQEKSTRSYEYYSVRGPVERCGCCWRMNQQ